MGKKLGPRKWQILACEHSVPYQPGPQSRQALVQPDISKD